MKNWRARIAGAVVGVATAVGLAGMNAVCNAGDVAATQKVVMDGKWRDLVARLGSQDFGVRRAAHEELERVPAEELARLKKLAAEAGDAEARAALVGRIEEISDRLMTDPPGISIDVKDATLGQVAEALARATGEKVGKFPDISQDEEGTERFTLKVVNEPFWDVFRKLSKQHALDLHRGKDLTLQFAADGIHDGMQVGGVMVFPRPIHPMVLNIGPGVGVKSRSVPFDIALDPRMPVIYYRGVNFTDLIDDAGNVLEPVGALGWQSRGTRQALWNDCVLVKVPEKPGTKIALVKGVVSLVLGTEEQSTEVSEIDKKWQTPIHFAGRTMTFKTFDAREEKIDLRLEIANTSDDPSLTPQQNELRTLVRLTLIDATGKELWNNFEMSGAAATIQSSYVLPIKVRFSIPMRIKELDVPFELKDLPVLVK